MLFNGESCTYSEFLEEYGESGIKFSNDNFVCAHVTWKNKPNGISSHRLVEMIEEETEFPFEVYGMIGISSKRMTFLISLPKILCYKKCIHYIYETMICHDCVGVNINVGKAISKIYTIKESYATLAQVNSYRFIFPENEIIYFDEINAE